MTAFPATNWMSGRLLGADEASIRADDRGLIGDGVFEVLKVVEGIPFARRRHLRRLAASADPLGIELDFDEIDAGMSAVVSLPHVVATPCWLRITVTGGPAAMGKAEEGRRSTVVVSAAPLPVWDSACDAIVVPWRRNERGALTGLKTLSYIENGVALRYARRHGADEGIFANTLGNLCEGSGTNVFVVLDGEITTPPLSAGALDGITRQLVLEWMPDIVVADLPIEALAECDEAFVTATSRDVHPVGTFDGRSLRVVRGELTAEVIACFEERSAADPDP